MGKPAHDEEALIQSLKRIVAEIEDTSDPEELNELRRIFRKAVPLFHRAYVSGYLLKKAGLVPDLGKPASRGDRPGQKPQRAERPERIRTERPEREKTERTERPPRNEVSRTEQTRQDASKDREEAAEATDATPRNENMTTLFFGVGRTRKVFPKDLINLIVETTSIDRESVGIIKILDNYSFVDIANEHAALVIEKLNKLEYRGRELSVNFAKKKD